MWILNFGWRKSTVFVLVLLLGLPCSRKLAAQVDMGSISGIIRDPSGAAIPNAKVVLTNEGTNITVCNHDGIRGAVYVLAGKSRALLRVSICDWISDGQAKQRYR